MAEDDADDSEKTEEPSQKRLDDARKKGNIAKSQEVTSWFMMLAATLFVMIFSGDMASSLAGLLSSYLAGAGDIPADGAAINQSVWLLLAGVAGAVLLPLLLFFFAGIGGNIVQHPPLLTTEPMKPALSKISPMAGFKRLFSAQSLVNFVKSLIKLVVVSVVVGAIIWPRRDLLDVSLELDPADLVTLLRNLALQVLGGVLAVLTLIAGLDYFWQYQSWHKKLRMSLKELRDEYKEQEGDPHIEARIRQIRRERASRRMMAQVPQASVVITNPTHYSVALKYESGMPAPLCLAKGQDLVALKIREIAREHDIPIVENPPLARALHATVEVDAEIPLEHYKAVAEVIGYVLRLKKKASA
jgi:flagellar biosynthetic protein FlhB